MEIALFVAAFLFGFAAKLVGLPPLVGYLVAGFVLHAFGYEVTEGIDTVADIGILLLLFGIGLKLRPRTLARPSVWVTATVFAAASTGILGLLLIVIGALGVPLARDLDPATAALGVGSLAVVALWPRVTHRVPGSLVALVLATGVASDSAHGQVTTSTERVIANAASGSTRHQ